MSDYERYAAIPFPSINVALKLKDGTPALGLKAIHIAVTYHIQNNSYTNIPLIDLATMTDVWTPGGVLEHDVTYWPGVYRIDLPHVILTAVPDVSVSIVGQPIIPKLVIIGIISDNTVPPNPGTVWADIRYINGVRINGGGVEDDEFQP